MPYSRTRRPVLTCVPADYKALPRNLGREHLAAMAGDGHRHALTSFRLAEKTHAAASARATALGGQGALPRGSFDELLDQRRGNARRVGFAQLPFFAEEPGHAGPV